jgi:hypothetical protein
MTYVAMPILRIAGKVLPTFRDMFDAGLDENKRYVGIHDNSQFNVWQFIPFYFVNDDFLRLVPWGAYVFTPWLSVLCMRSKAWLAARVSLRLRRLRSKCAAAPVLLAHAEVKKT